MKRSRNVFWNPLSAVDLRDPLGKRCEHRAVIHFLEAFAVTGMTGDLADEQDHRRRILEGRVHADRRVRSTRPPGHETDPGSTRQLPVGFRHVGGGAFVACTDDADAGRIMQSVEHRQVALAGEAEHAIDALAAQRLNQYLSAGDAHR